MTGKKKKKKWNIFFVWQRSISSCSLSSKYWLKKKCQIDSGREEAVGWYYLSIHSNGIDADTGFEKRKMLRKFLSDARAVLALLCVRLGLLAHSSTSIGKIIANRYTPEPVKRRPLMSVAGNDRWARERNNKKYNSLVRRWWRAGDFQPVLITLYIRQGPFTFNQVRGFAIKQSRAE